MIDFVTKITEIIYELGVKVKVLCIDREFYTHAVMGYLQSQYFTNWIRKSSIPITISNILTEKYFEIGMKLNDFSIQLVKY
ncbi:hypothetical protein [Methanosarcina sp. WH1]|nr:hypothetical protein [Methanosarcina sp. WH1]AKB18993.1 hypothetical protein MSWHS_2130 [Methanosarcina sp. WWM596]